jgi:hypothetical protein
VERNGAIFPGTGNRVERNGAIFPGTGRRSHGSPEKKDIEI